MKSILFPVAFSAIVFASCNSSDSAKNNNEKKTDTTQSNLQAQSTATVNQGTPVIQLLTGYLKLKNALTNDNGKEAADAGKAMVEVFGTIDSSSFTSEQKKVFNDLEPDIKEHFEHISMNADKIAHQREHFVMLSKDIADLVKAFGSGGQVLYKDFCPMANDNKGAIWISEVKEIKNPYFGSKMPACGTIKDTIR